MADLPEKMCVRSGVLCETKDGRFSGLSTEAIEEAAHRYNIHKRLVGLCDALMKELDNIVAEREGDALVIWLRIVQEAKQLLKEEMGKVRI